MAEHGKLNVLQIHQVYWTRSEVWNTSCVRADLPLAPAHWHEIEIFCPWLLDRAQECCKESFLLLRKREREEEECQDTAAVLLVARPSTAGSVLHHAWQVLSCTNPTADFCQRPLFGCGIRDTYCHRYSERFQACKRPSPTRLWILLKSNHGLEESFTVHFGSFA